MSEWFKWVGALLLTGCLVLPMTSCTRYFDSEGYDITAKIDRYEPIPPGVRFDVNRDYLLSTCSVSLQSCAMDVASFSAPMVGIALSRRFRHFRAVRMLWWLEPLLIWWLYILLDLMTLWGQDPEAGWFVAAGGIVLYSLGWCGQACAKALHLLHAARQRSRSSQLSSSS